VSQYAPKKWSKKQIVSPDLLAAELTAIGNAYGDATHTLDATNFPEHKKFVPNGSLALPNNVVVKSLKYSGTLTGALAYGTYYGRISVPHGMVCARLSFICTAVTGTVQMRVMGTEQTLSAAATVYPVTPSPLTQVYNNYQITLEVQAGAGESITNPRCDMTFISNHIFSALPI